MTFLPQCHYQEVHLWPDSHCLGNKELYWPPQGENLHLRPAENKKNNKPLKSLKKLTHNILLSTFDTLASVCKFSILHSMHFLRCSLVINVTKTFPLPFFNTQIFILKLLLRVYMKHCQTTKKEILIQVQPKHCYELFWLLTIWCGTQALMRSLWLIDLVSTHVAQRGPTTGPFCTPHSILKSRFFFPHLLYL